MIKRTILIVFMMLMVTSLSSLAGEKPPTLGEFYAQTMAELMGNEQGFAELMAWANKASPQQVKESLFGKIEQAVMQHGKQSAEARNEFYARVCTLWAGYGVNFGSRGANSNDFEAHRRWAKGQRTAAVIDQLRMRINLIVDSYSGMGQRGVIQQPARERVTLEQRTEAKPKMVERLEIDPKAVKKREMVLKAIRKVTPQDLKTVSQPLSRRMMINILAADPTTHSVLTSLGKNNVNKGNQMVNQRNLHLNTYPKASEWLKGFQFTPNSPGPTYVYGGRTYTLGAHYIDNMILYEESLKDLVKKDVIYILLKDCHPEFYLYVELPGPGAYMVTMGMKIFAPGYTMPKGQSAKKLPVFVKAYVNDKMLSYTSKPDDSGIVGVFSTGPKFGYQKSSSKAMRRMSTTIKLTFTLPWLGTGIIAYGGTTIVKL